jgi:hypothetical protein
MVSGAAGDSPALHDCISARTAQISVIRMSSLFKFGKLVKDNLV